jgi:flagellar basal body-associated protein FliL
MPSAQLIYVTIIVLALAFGVSIAAFVVTEQAKKRGKSPSSLPSRTSPVLAQIKDFFVRLGAWLRDFFSRLFKGRKKADG